MKKVFPFLMLRIAGAILILGAAAFLLMAIVKILVLSLLVIGVGAMIAKMAQRRRNRWASLEGRQSLPFQRYQNQSLAIQPMYRTPSTKHASIVPIQ